MRENLELTRGLVFSGTLLLRAGGEGRSRARTPTRSCSSHAMETWDRGGDFRERVLAEPRIRALLSKEEIERAFSLDEALRHVDAIFERTLGREGGGS